MLIRINQEVAFESDEIRLIFKPVNPPDPIEYIKIAFKRTDCYVKVFKGEEGYEELLKYFYNLPSLSPNIGAFTGVVSLPCAKHKEIDIDCDDCNPSV